MAATRDGGKIYFFWLYQALPGFTRLDEEREEHGSVERGDLSFWIA